jgi:tetratricopeptide (TPR) repeat protein
VATYEEAISLAPADWSLWVSLGNLYLEMEEYSESLSAYEQASEMNPNAPEPWLGQGDVYVAREKWSTAQEAYEEAQRLRPNQIESLLRLANLYEERDNLSKARDYATKAIEVDPVSASGYVTLGRIQLARENASKAAEAYMSAIQRDPRRPAAYSSWMWCYTDIKRAPYRVIMDRLEDELEEIADSEDAGTVWAQALLGLGYLNLEEDPDLIIGHLEEAIRMDPNFVELYQELASLYEENGDTARALELWYRYLYATARTSDTSEIQEHLDLMLQGQIEQPAGGDSVSGSVEIIGTATGEKFLWYTVEYSASGSDSWSTITKKESRVENSTLATWNTAGLSPGEYRIRLEVIMAKSKDPSYEVTVEVQP